MSEEKLYSELEMNFTNEETALLCIDLQYYDTMPGFGFLKDKAYDDEEYGYYFKRLDETVFDNVYLLQERFRSDKMEVIHVKIESMTEDGRDRSPGHKKIGCFVKKGTKDAEIVERVEPKGDEIVIAKTASGVFNSTNIDYILKNLGIKNLVITGVLTNECVENAVRAAADMGYSVIMVNDATAAFSKELHDHSIRALDGVYCKVVETKDVLKMLSV